MPKVTITRLWAANDRLHISAAEDSGHPDGLLGEVKRIAVEAYDEALRTTMALEASDKESDS